MREQASEDGRLKKTAFKLKVMRLLSGNCTALYCESECTSFGRNCRNMTRYVKQIGLWMLQHLHAHSLSFAASSVILPAESEISEGNEIDTIPRSRLSGYSGLAGMALAEEECRTYFTPRQQGYPWKLVLPIDRKAPATPPFGIKNNRGFAAGFSGVMQRDGEIGSIGILVSTAGYAPGVFCTTQDLQAIRHRRDKRMGE